MAATPGVVSEVKPSTSFPQQLGDTCDYAAKMAPNLEKEFVRLKDITYLDHAGATLYADSQLRSVVDELANTVYGNPHSRNPSSQLTSEAIDQVRFRILQFFNADVEDYDVVFTSNATAALKLVGECLEWRRGDLFAYTEDNHTSVLGIRALAAKGEASVRCLTDDQMNELSSTSENKKSASLKAEFSEFRTPAGQPKPIGLFAFPAESNFCGRKYPLEWIERMIWLQLDPNRYWLCLLDAAGLVATNPLDLSVHRPDFVCISFYKMFGFPTGVGALIVNRRAIPSMQKTYFGGGTVLLALPSENFHVSRNHLHDRMEDGSLQFLDILAIRHGLNTLQTLAGGMEAVSQRTFELGRYVHDVLSSLRHANGQPVAELYCRSGFGSSDQQGAIVTFNILRADGSHTGFGQVEKMASLYNIHLRTGCFCNPGACRQYLKLTRDDLLRNYEAGHVCGDDKDLIDGRPTGAVRISFGYMSTKKDADKLLLMIGDCFVERNVREELVTTEKREMVSTTCNCHSCNVEPCTQNHLTNIFIYPIKSCAAFEVSSWKIGPRGFVFDREWVVVNSNGVSLTQKREPRLCLVRPAVDLEKGVLWLSCEDFATISVPLEVSMSNTSQDTRCKVCRDSLSMLDCGDDVADWISEVLGNPGCRLLRHHPHSVRKNRIPASTAPADEQLTVSSVSLANTSQFVLLSRASVHHLLETISRRYSREDDEKAVEEALDVEGLLRRFRANLIVSGNEAYSEDVWNHVRIGQLPFEVHGCCSRCQMVSIDQETGCKSKEPLLTLSATRGRKIPFGIHLHHQHANNEFTTIRVGDPVKFRSQAN